MKVIHRIVKTIHEENFIRSTMEPSIRATVMPAKVIWNRAKTKVGIVPDRLFTPMPPMKKWSKPPIIPPWLEPKARVYPHIIQMTLARQ